MNELHDDAIEALLRTHFEGPVADAGFSDRVMRSLPPRRRRNMWPPCLGVLAGMAACLWSLKASPLLQAGWRAWLGGELSVPVFGMWLMIAAMSWLALGWGLAESGNR